MPAKGEKDLIATMPAARFGVTGPYPTADVCPTIREFTSPVDWMLSGMEQYPQYTAGQNEAAGVRIQELRTKITHHALATGIDLSAVQAGRQSLDGKLTEYFRELQETAMELALHNYALVRYTYFRVLPGVASGILNDTQREEAVIQAGLMGLHDAALRVDPAKGKFSGYAVATIRGRMLTEMVETRGIERREYEVYRQYKLTAKQCEEETGKHDFDTVVKAMYRKQYGNNISTKDNKTYVKFRRTLKNLLYKLEPISVEELIVIESYDHPESVKSHLPVDPDDHFEQTWQEERRERVEAALGRLTQRERQVLELRFGLGGGKDHTLEEVAHFFNLTRERARQIEAKGIGKMRNPTVLRNLRDFLS